MGRKKREAPAAPPAFVPPPISRVEPALFVTTLILYLATMARGPSWGDSSELTLVAGTFSIAHPTGYPLYTLLGWFVSKLPLGPLPVRVGLLSAIPVAAAVVLVYRLALRFAPRKPAAAAALAFGCWSEPWSQAVVPEVYGLHLAFVTAVLLALARLLEEPTPRRLDTLAALTGLAFAHHLQTVFLVPALIFALVFDTRLRPLLSGRTLVCLIGPGALYGLLWVRAQQDPFVDQSAGNLLAHMTGRQFAYRMFGEASHPGDELARLVKEVVHQPGPFALLSTPLILLAASGAVRAHEASPLLARSIALASATCVIYTLNYNIPDKSAYYLTLHVAVALSLAAALSTVVRAVALVTALTVLIPLGTNYSRTERASDSSLSDYAADLLRLTPKDGLLVTDDLTLWWGLIYRQQVEGLDRHCATLCTYPLRLRWYLPLMRKMYPKLAIPDAAYLELAKGLTAVETTGDPTGQESQSLTERLAQSIVAANLERGPVTLVIHQTSEELKTWLGWPLQPQGLAYRVLTQPAPPEPYATDYAPPERHRIGTVHGPDRVRVARRYATALNRLGILRIGLGQLPEAEQAFRRALEYDPRYAQVLTNLGVLYDQHMKRPEETYKVYRRFLEIAPDDKQAPAVVRWLGQYQSRLVGR